MCLTFEGILIHSIIESENASDSIFSNEFGNMTSFKELQEKAL